MKNKSTMHMNQENRKKNFISQLIRMENDFLIGNNNSHEEVSKGNTDENGQEWFDVLNHQLDNGDV